MILTLSEYDGDKNAIYVLPLTRNGYDCRDSFAYHLAKLELADAFHKSLTLIATPRYSISETNMVTVYRHKDKFADIPFAQRTLDKGPR